MTARAKRIRAAVTIDTGNLSDILLDAIALMLDAATARESKKAPAKKYNLPISPGEMVSLVRTRLAGKLIADPIAADWYGRIGKAMGQVDGLTRADIDTLVEWIDAGGLNWWTYGVPTFVTLCTNFSKWMPEAREWHNRGRQVLGKKGGVGQADVSGGSTFDDFK
jgi:hypothetical protein